MTRLMTATSTFLCAATAWAHPGHGTPGESETITHYLTEPVHVGAGVLFLLAVFFLVRVLRRLFARSEAKGAESMP